jgi:hypothetical protein
MRGFSGHLPPDQLLDLWDLVLGYDSLEVLPILAVSILSFRKDNLLDVDTIQNIEVNPYLCSVSKYFECSNLQAVLADLSSVPVVALIQLALMKDSSL